MAVDTPARRHERPDPASLQSVEAPYWYSMFGQLIRSDIRLPTTPLPAVVGAEPAWVIRRAASGAAPAPEGAVVNETRCDGPCGGSHAGTRVIRGDGGTWFWYYLIGTCHVSPDARRVDVYLEAEADERDLGVFLAGPVAVFVLHQLGYPCLHASAVVTERGAIAFFGPKGQGKSTMAASFLRRGAALLTDDVLPLQPLSNGIHGLPSLPIMKLWPESAERTLHLRRELPQVLTYLDKKLLQLEDQYSYAKAPARLRALYVLERFDPRAAGHAHITIRPLEGWEALQAMLTQISYGAFLTPAEAACFLPLYTGLLAQTTVRVLSYPHGFELQEAVHERILVDLDAP